MEGPHPSSPPLRPWGKEQWEEWHGVGLGGRGTSSNSQTSLSRLFRTPLSAYAQSGAMLQALCCNAAAPSHRRVLHLPAAATRAAASMPYVLVPDTVPPFTRMLTTSHSLPLPRWTCSRPFSLCSPSHKSPGLISAWLRKASAFLWVPRCKWELFSSQLPSSFSLEIRDRYPSASFISDLSLPRFLSHSLVPQIRVPNKDFLFCFAVAVPGSAAAAATDIPAVGKLWFS